MAHQTGIERESLISLGCLGKLSVHELASFIAMSCVLCLDMEIGKQSSVPALCYKEFIVRCVLQEPCCSQYVVVDHR